MPVNLLDTPAGPDFWRQAADILNNARLVYIARYWETQVFGETMSGVDPNYFISRLDTLMRQHPEIDG